MPEAMDFPNAQFLNKIFVDEYIKQKYEENILWEQHCKKQSVNALSVLWYQEDYIDIETPNDSDMSAPIDTELKRPALRASGGLFPMTEYSHVVEKNAALYQLGLQGAITEEAIKYTEMEDPILRIQRKLANSMASEVNRVIGNTIAESWVVSPTLVNDIDVTTAWSTAPTSSALDPVGDILSAIEAIEDLSGYNYSADTLFVSKQTYFDLRNWAAYNDYQLQYEHFGGETKIPQIEGLNIIVSNMVKRTYAVVMDSKEAVTIFEAQPVTTDTFFEPTTREYYFQIMKTFYPALTDPKAISLLSGVA